MRLGVAMSRHRNQSHVPASWRPRVHAHVRLGVAMSRHRDRGHVPVSWRPIARTHVRLGVAMSRYRDRSQVQEIAALQGACMRVRLGVATARRRDRSDVPASWRPKAHARERLCHFIHLQRALTLMCFGFCLSMDGLMRFSVHFFCSLVRRAIH